MTFSIVAWDPDAPSGPDWGVAVASKFLAVGSVVPHARAGVGAVATQALANLSYGPDGLARLAAGEKAAAVVAELTGADDEREQRQVGVVDAAGRAATFTGTECFEWAGGVTGEGYCCQGNILAGEPVVADMQTAFTAASGELADRMMVALRAGDAAGGDARGRQSAALLVVRAGGGYLGDSDVAVDLRVDDHRDPVAELARLFDLHRLYFPRPEALEWLRIDAALADRIRLALGRLGYEVAGEGAYDDELKKKLFEYVGRENLENRWSDEHQIEAAVFSYLTEEAARARLE